MSRGDALYQSYKNLENAHAASVQNTCGCSKIPKQLLTNPNTAFDKSRRSFGKSQSASSI